VGIGLAWLCDGLGSRTDVRVVSVERDPRWAELAASLDWPPFVTLETGDILESFPRLGRYDLIFADAQGGRWTGLDHTIAALSPGGMLVVDDLQVGPDAAPDVREQQPLVAERLRHDPRLLATELEWATGVLLATRVRG
jgi:demethylmenaquinone methyltransferase/2-methoxy-6-polyprenyl-1,4-benzoquinol methylase